MKRRVFYSTYTMTVSTILLAFLCYMGYRSINKDDEFAMWLYFGVTVFFCLMALLFAPLSISLSDTDLSIHRSFRIKNIPLTEISSVKLCPPTMAERRLFGSGGFFGYWGWFSEPSIGRYFAYYGKASDCFLVTLKNGKKYVLGCQDAPKMAEAIAGKI